jgi:hypothetical protein
MGLPVSRKSGFFRMAVASLGGHPLQTHAVQSKGPKFHEPATQRSPAMGRKRDFSKELRHVRLNHWMLRTEAWQSLSALARALYVELSSRYHGTNNGEIIFSVRQAAEALHVSKDAAARAFEELQARGFLAVRRKGGFNLKERKGQATEWRLTEFAYGTAPYGTKEFASWTKGKDLPVDRGPKPNNVRKAGRLQYGGDRKPIPLANYKRPTRGTVERKIGPLESHFKDQKVTSMQQALPYRTWSVTQRTVFYLEL